MIEQDLIFQCVGSFLQCTTITSCTRGLPTATVAEVHFHKEPQANKNTRKATQKLLRREELTPCFIVPCTHVSGKLRRCDRILHDTPDAAPRPGRLPSARPLVAPEEPPDSARAHLVRVGNLGRLQEEVHPLPGR